MFLVVCWLRAPIQYDQRARQEDLPELIDFGTCSLHAVDGALRAGSSNDGEVMEFLKHSYAVFKNITSRRADYTEFASIDNPPLPKKYCATRWVENVQAAERAIQALPHIISYIRAMEQNFSEPHSQSYRSMKASALHPLFGAKLAFLLSVARDFQEFLLEFQTERPMLPHLHNSLWTLFENLLRRFMKPDVLHHNSSITKRLHLTFDESTMLETSKIDVGFGAKAEIRTVLAKQGNPQELQRLRALVKDFRRECRESLKSMAKKMIIRTPLSSAFIQGCAALDPAIICSSDEKSELLSQSLLILVQLKWLSGDEADTIKRKYRTLCTSPAFLERMKSYNRGIDRLDNFFGQRV